MEYKTLNKLLSPFIKLIWPTKIFYKENIEKSKNIQAIYICNHYTLSDTNPLIAKIFKDDINVLIKAEVFKHKLLGKLLIKMGGIPVKRQESDLKAVKEVMKRLKNGKSMLIYPEGTRNKEGTKNMLPFKTGTAWFALIYKLPVVPILYYKPLRPFRRNYIIVGEPIYLNQYEGQDPNKAKVEATQVLYNKMQELRCEIDKLIEGKKVKIKDLESK